MSQTYTSTNPASGSTTFGELYQIVRDHFAACVSNFAGSSAPGTPTEGQTWYDTTNDVMQAYDGSTWRDIDYNTDIYDEIVAARGTASSLTARLDASLNADGTISGATPSGAWWTSSTTPWLYYSTVQWQEAGNLTAVFTKGRAVYITGVANPGYSIVTSAVYAGATTTITIKDAILDTSMNTPQYGQSDFNYHGNIPWTRALLSNSATSRDYAPSGYGPIADGAGGVTVASLLNAATALTNNKKYGCV